MGRGSARRPSLKGRERAIVNQTNTDKNHFKGNIGDTSERQGGVHMGILECIATTLNWTELLSVI